MKVIIASTKTQGQRSNDFANATPGELLYFGSECSRGTVDDKCGCKRALCGIDSHKGTTTGEVAERDLTPEQIETMFRASMIAAGWLKEDQEDSFGLLKGTVEDFMLLCQFAERLPVGTPMERRGTILRQRLDTTERRPRRRRSA